MQRREFAKSTILGVFAAATVPIASKAESTDPYKNVVFTEADLGHWSPQIEKLHIPDTTIAGGKLTIRTPHPMSEAHYIVSHTVVLADGTFLSRRTFTYKDDPVSEHALPAGYTGKVTVTSTCNQVVSQTETLPATSTTGGPRASRCRIPTFRAVKVRAKGFVGGLNVDRVQQSPMHS